MKSPRIHVKNWRDFVIEPMHGKPWIERLEEFGELLHNRGFKWQLGSGTLLAAVREPDWLIHHDTDIDLDVLVYRDNKEVLAETLQLIDDAMLVGYEVVRTQHYRHGKDALQMQLAFIHKATNIIVDLCYFYKFWGDDYLNIYEHGLFIRPSWSENTGTIIVGTKEYPVPADTNKYLEGRFGIDWVVPKDAKTCGSKTAGEFLLPL